MPAKNPAICKFIKQALKSNTDDCISWPFALQNGYGYWGHTYVHRLVCYVRFGEPTGNKTYACHSCNNRQCINPKHLSWQSQAENLNYAVRDQLSVDNLNKAVREESHIPQAKLALKYNVSQSTISRILMKE